MKVKRRFLSSATVFPLIVPLFLAGCGVVSDPGPVVTKEQSVEGKPEKARVEISIGTGELKVSGGATKLMEGVFRHSEGLGDPEISYDGTEASGRLVIKGKKRSTMVTGNITNNWRVRLANGPAYDLAIEIGAGSGDVDLSSLDLRGLKLQVGAGQLDVNLDGKYTRNIDVDIQGGVGEMNVRLPKGFGVEASMQGGIGSFKAPGLTKRGESYYNEAYQDNKPAMRIKVQAGVGEIRLTTGE